MEYWSRKLCIERIERQGDLLSAWVPEDIKDRGNGTHLYLQEGRECHGGVSSPAMGRILLKRYAVDGTVIRVKYKHCSGMSQNYPIIVGSQTFFAVQCREKTRGKNDGCMGYVDAEAILHLTVSAGGTTVITLKNGLCIETLWSPSAVMAQRNRAIHFRKVLTTQGVIPSL